MDNIFQKKVKLVLSDLKESVPGSILICGEILLLPALNSSVIRFGKDEEIFSKLYFILKTELQTSSS